MPTHDLEGKVAVVTGGGRGIGRGIAHRFAEEGMDVAIVDTDELDFEYNQYGSTEIGGYDEAKAVVAEIEDLGREAMALDCDVSKADEVNDAVQTVIDDWGTIDVMVNNAGIITAGHVEELADQSGVARALGDGRGGVCADVVDGGAIAVGDDVVDLGSRDGTDAIVERLRSERE